MKNNYKIMELQRRQRMKKMINNFFTKYIAPEYQKILTDMEYVFGEQLNSYMIAVYELDDFISNIDFNTYNCELMENVKELIVKIQNYENKTIYRIGDIND